MHLHPLKIPYLALIQIFQHLPQALAQHILLFFRQALYQIGLCLISRAIQHRPDLHALIGQQHPLISGVLRQAFTADEALLLQIPNQRGNAGLP